MRWKIVVVREDDVNGGDMVLQSTQFITEAEVKKIQLNANDSLAQLVKAKAAAAFYNIIAWSAEAIK